jgi:hypothetical protein
LKVSSEIFQRKLTEAVGDLNGTFTIADNITIARCGQTDKEAKRDHETKLCKLYARCKEQNIILNDEKKEIGLKEITFHGHKITSDGVKVDDKKVNEIREMPTPTDVAGVKRAVHGKILTRSRERDGTDMRTDKERSSLELVK